MAPVLSGVWWGPEAGVAGSGAAAAGSVASWLGSEQLVLVCTLSALSGLLLVSVVLLLCAGCQGQKKAVTVASTGDHENLMNGVSERETLSQSADSPATDLAVSSSHNGPLTSGTILTDTLDTSPQPSDDMPSSQSELRSSKCPQDRELPRIPPNNGLMGDGAPPSGDSTYEVVKEMAAASRDVSVEDSLYETVKELKDRPPAQPGLPNGTAPPTPDRQPAPGPAPLLLNGHLSPGTPERGPLCAAVEYASVDLNKKSRHSADVDARGRCDPPDAPRKEEPEDDPPPPVPEKVLDGNDNRTAAANGPEGAGLHNGELPSPLSPTPGFDDHDTSDNESPVYSTVNKTVNDDDKEHDYSSIAELKGLVPASSSSDLYASVSDIYAHPDRTPPEEDPAMDATDPGYETIRIPKTGSPDDERGAGQGAEGADATDVKPEPDYESVGELGLSQELSRL